MSADLLFKGTQPANLNLVFGATESGGTDYIDATIAADVGVISVSCTLAAQYDNAVNRSVQTATGMSWSDAERAVSNVTVPTAKPVSTRKDTDIASDAAQPVLPEQKLSWDYSKRTQANTKPVWDSANQVPKTTAVNYLIPARKPRSVGLGYQDADKVAVSETETWINLFRAKRPTVTAPWEEGKHHSKAFDHSFSVATRLFIKGTLPWDAAKKAPPGISPHVVAPGNPDPDKCYTPPAGSTVSLLFSEIAVADGNLYFRCPNKTPTGETVIVPVRRAYIVINQVNLRRVSDNAIVPCYSMALDLDCSSWTWGFSASLHYSAQAIIEPSAYGSPVELKAEINGNMYRVFVESIATERQFGEKRINVSGRGRSAVLADPYAPIKSFSNAGARTAQQLMNDVLTENGVSIGWTVDWNLTDWLVPSGMFSHNGTYMSALNAIAEAAGGYIQPDAASDTLYVKHRYPTAPWEWNSATPDFILPSAVVKRDSITAVDKVNYNGIYVSGTTNGVLALVKREGSAGDLLAPMIVDPLITHADAARQRGKRVLGETGRIATVVLEMPVLSETGIILPGNLIEYQDDGVSRRGLTRSVSVSADYSTVYQKIEVETHVL